MAKLYKKNGALEPEPKKIEENNNFDFDDMLERELEHEEGEIKEKVPMQTFDSYKEHLDMIANKKKQLIDVIIKKREAHRKFRQAYKEHCARLNIQYRELAEQEKDARLELVRLCPNEQMRY